MIFSTNKSYFVFPMDTIVLFIALFLLLSVGFIVLVSKKLKSKRKKAAGLWSLAWLLTGIFMYSSGTFGRFVDVENIHRKTYTKNELAEDLQQLEKCILEENPLYFADANEMQQLFAVAYENIQEGMTELEFYRLVNPVVAAVNCGHTNLSVSEALYFNRKQTAKFFPLKVTLAGNKLYVLEDDHESGIAAGDEIKSINGMDSGEIISILVKNINGDGDYETKRRHIISRHFNSRFYDFVDSSDNFKVVLVNKEGLSKTADLQAEYREEFNTTAWELHFAEYEEGNYYESKIYDNYAVLTVHFFNNEKDNRFDSFLNDFFIKLKEKNISKLVVDLRGNYGGDSFMTKSLLSHLTAEEFDYFDGDLPFLYRMLGFNRPVSPKETVFGGDVAVLTDGAGFSTTAHLCALIKHHNLGTIVGSETGGSYVCTDGSKDAVLNHTRMNLHYSTLAFKVKVEGFSEQCGVKPDIYVPAAIEDILERRDRVMERALKVLF